MVVALVVQAVLLAGLAFFGYRIYRNAPLFGYSGRLCC